MMMMLCIIIVLLTVVCYNYILAVYMHMLYIMYVWGVMAVMLHMHSLHWSCLGRLVICTCISNVHR